MQKSARRRRGADGRASKAPRLDDFLPLGLLGRGGFGSVWLAVHQQQDWVCALKVIDKAAAPALATVTLERHAHVSSQAMDGSSIVPLHAVWQDAHHVYMALQFMAGGDVWSLLHKQGARGSITERQAACVVAGAARGLAAVHAAGYIMRDAKPDNVMLSAGGQPFLIDFGLATRVAAPARGVLRSPGNSAATLRPARCPHKLASSVRDTPAMLPASVAAVTRCGTPGYCAPEVLDERGAGYTRSADIWALGMIAWEMLTGVNPLLIGTDIMRTCQAVVAAGKHGMPWPPCDAAGTPIPLSPNAADFLRQCCAAPDRRPSAAQLATHAWLRGAPDSVPELVPEGARHAERLALALARLPGDSSEAAPLRELLVEALPALQLTDPPGASWAALGVEPVEPQEASPDEASPGSRARHRHEKLPGLTWVSSEATGLPAAPSESKLAADQQQQVPAPVPEARPDAVPRVLAAHAAAAHRRSRYTTF